MQRPYVENELGPGSPSMPGRRLPII
ncbi:unnamed protein product [Brucella canis str. Oliveri]|nr:unnamed protein product [Brucella canis str. Oliveri]